MSYHFIGPVHYLHLLLKRYFMTGEHVMATQWAFCARISCYVGMVPFQIENRYCYGYKIPELQFQWLKENQLEELDGVIRQKVAEILPEMF